MMLKALRRSYQRILASALAGVLILGHILGLYTLGPILQIDRAIYDVRLRLDAPGGVDKRVVILDIDEQSLAHPQLGRWPWSRDVMARLVETLFDDYGVRALGFDVIFAEPDRSSGLGVLQALSKNQLRENQAFLATLQDIAPQLDYDGKFAQSLQGRPVVMGYYFSASQAALRQGELPFPTLELADLANLDTDFTRWQGFGANLPVIASSALMAGHFSPTVDVDGVIRRVPMLAQFEDGYYESLSLAMARLDRALSQSGGVADGLRFEAIEPLPQAGRLESLRIGEQVLPVDPGSNLLVPYRGPAGSFPYVSVSDLWQGKVDPSVLRDRLVLVGTTAPGLLDLRTTPVGAIFPGVEVHANLIAAMLSDQPSRLKATPTWAPLAEFLLAAMIALLLPLALAAGSVVAGAGLVSTVLVGLVLTNFWAWSQGLALPLAALLVLVLGIYSVNLVIGFFIETRSKRQFKELFGQYVPPELVEKMAEDPEQYSMEGRRETLTVLFSDVVGFNPISQALKPKELAEFINHYLTEMSAVIRDTGGTLDKYIGDCIMAFWGAPVADPDHASNAVKAALGMKSKLYEIRDYCEKRGWPRLAIGIGLSTGEMVVGDMGSHLRKSYTVMGDAVNTGSRLENVTRVYGSWILVSEATQKACKGIVFREVDFVRVKGRGEPIRCFEPLGLDTDVSNERRDEIDRWHEALSAYRSQEWDVALAILRSLQAQRPLDKLYELFISRSEEYKSSPPDASWDGVTTFETKKG